MRLFYIFNKLFFALRLRCFLPLHLELAGIYIIVINEAFFYIIYSMQLLLAYKEVMDLIFIVFLLAT